MSKQTYSQRAHDYARRVVAGEVLASKWIKLLCKQHLADLDKYSRWSFDAKKANLVCAFAETCRHEKGVLQGQPLKLEDFQCFILASIFGWMDDDGIRKYREVLILMPRGNGKSPLAAVIALWMTFFDGEKGSECYTAATTLEQAKEVYRPAKAFVEQSDALLALGITPAATSIYHTARRCRFVPIIGRAKYGGSVYLGIMDESHQLPDSQLYAALKTGTNKRRNSLLLTISTAGVTAANNPCYALQQEGQRILEGTVENERFLAIIHCADDTVEWTSPDAVVMANPNLGISNDREAVMLDHAEAVRNPAKQNTFRQMHLNQWTGAASAWMNMADWHNCADPTLTPEKVRHLPCWIGSDLASVLDMAATVRVHKDVIDGKPHYYAFCRAYLPQKQVNQPENRHYQKWVKQGFLTATPDNSIDYSVIERDVLEDIAAYQVQALPYDLRYADQWSQRVATESGVTRVEVPPSPKELSPAMKELESAVADGRLHHTGDPVLTWAMSNVLSRETSLGNYTMPDKAKPELKIDPAIALLIALSRARLTQSEQHYEVPWSV